MAEESQDGQEKTEDPTQKKIQKGQEEGQVLNSKELFVFSTLFAAFVLMYVVPMVSGPIISKWSRMFHFERPKDLNTLMGEKFHQVAYHTNWAGLVI